MTEPYTIIRRFLFQLVGMMSLDKNDREVINSSFVLPSGLRLNILRTEEILQFSDKEFSTRVARCSSAMGTEFRKIYRERERERERQN